MPVSKLFGAFVNARQRKRWLPDKIDVRSSSPSKRMRISMEDDTVVEVSFMSKGDAKSAVAIQHSKLPDKPTADKVKAWWAERFEALSEILT